MGDVAEELTAGSLVADRFEVVSLVGQGASASVYRAVDRQTGTTVALKTLRHDQGANPANLPRFIREAKVLAALRHPGIVRYVEQGVTLSGRPFLAMEWVEGVDLRVRLDSGSTPLETIDVVRLGQALAESLAALHAGGVVHRDLKPSNIVLVDGNAAKPKLLDFGIARDEQASRALTRTGHIVGTPSYMAPEQVTSGSDVNGAADVFALGCVLYECLARRPAFAALEINVVLAKVVNQSVPALQNVPSALAMLVASMLDKDPTRRPDPHAIGSRLREIEGELVPANDRAPSSPESTPPPPPKRPDDSTGWLRWYSAPQPQLSLRERRWHSLGLRLLPIGAGIHLGLIALFAALHVPVLAWFNVGSVIVYLVASVARRYGRERLAYWLPVFELFAHAAACVHQMGWLAGSYLTIFLAPLLGGARITRVERGLVVVAGTFTFVLASRFGPPAVVLAPNVLFALFLVGVVVVLGTLSVAVDLLDDTASRLEVELEQERARTEELLQLELSHQVAERSRVLGDVFVQGQSFRSHRPKVGDRFDERYRITRELGAGGMGVVFEVERATDTKRLALKVVTGDVSPQRAARFAREAEIGARIRHPNLVAIVDVGVAHGQPYLAMELAPEGSLEDRRARFGDAAWAHPILTGVAQGLAALHAAGVVHRDLKPANVLLVGPEDSPTPKISDFGISRFGDSESDVARATASTQPRGGALTAAGVALGTPAYMAPETLRPTPVEAPADVFAFGILAVELFSGTSPFVVPPVFRARAGLPLDAPVGIEALPESLRDLVVACLDEAPSRRPSMGKVSATLSRV